MAPFWEAPFCEFGDSILSPAEFDGSILGAGVCGSGLGAEPGGSILGAAWSVQKMWSITYARLW